jgi:hypothetical protein
MKRLLPILVFMLASASSYAQNWNPLNPGVKRYFTNVYGYLKGMRIDSVAAFGNELHYYPFKTKRAHRDDGIYYSDTSNVAGSWLGEVIIKKQDGSFRIPNYWSDTILIRPQAQTGDSWTFYDNGSDVYYIAHISTTDTMTILGSVDSVKRIVLNAYDNGNPMPADSLDGLEIVISNAHGFYQVPELYMFPFHSPGATTPVPDYFFFNSVVPWDVYGFGWLPVLPGADNSVFRLVEHQPKTEAEINDWNVGDVFEYSSCAYSCVGGSYFYHLDTIISKVVDVNGVYFGMRGWLATRNGNYFTLEPHTDTVFFSGNLSEQMYEEYIAGSWSNGALTHHFPADTSFCMTSGLHYSFAYHSGLPGRSGYIVYKDGVGIVKEYSSSPPDEDKRELIYFLKDGVPCGTFFMPDTTVPVTNYNTNINETADVNIYPNPTFGQLNIETSLSNYQLSLINVTGQVVCHRASCNTKQTIDVEGLANGVYNLKLETAEREVINRKVFIQN